MHQIALATNLSVQPVFDGGFVIHARSDETGIRIVSFENIELLHLKANGDFSKSDKQPVIVGYGETVELALRQALIGFVKNLPHSKMHPRWRPQPKASKETMSKLDHWLVKHKGTLTAVQDEDGTVICRLEGSKDPGVHNITRVIYTGTGLTLRSALNNAFQKPQPITTPKPGIHISIA